MENRKLLARRKEMSIFVLSGLIGAATTLALLLLLLRALAPEQLDGVEIVLYPFAVPVIAGIIAGKFAVLLLRKAKR